jgi:hypothetical protein
MGSPIDTAGITTNSILKYDGSSWNIGTDNGSGDYLDPADSADVAYRTWVTDTFLAQTDTNYTDSTDVKGWNFMNEDSALYATQTDLLGVDYAPASVDVQYGTLTSGTVDSLTALDGDLLTVTEANGPTPVLRTVVTFTGVDRITNARAYGRYQGSTSHSITVQLYNFTLSSWNSLGEMEHSTTNQWYSYSVFNSSDYVSAGVCSLRFEHLSSGVNSHKLYLDYTAIGTGSYGAGITAHSSLTGLDHDDHTQYLLDSDTGSTVATKYDVSLKLNSAALDTSTVVFWADSANELATNYDVSLKAPYNRSKKFTIYNPKNVSDTLWTPTFDAGMTFDSIYAFSYNDTCAFSLVKAARNGGTTALIVAMDANTAGTNSFYKTATSFTTGSISAQDRIGYVKSTDSTECITINIYWH